MCAQVIYAVCAFESSVYVRVCKYACVCFCVGLKGDVGQAGEEHVGAKGHAGYKGVS